MNDRFQHTLQYLYDLQFFGMKLGLDHIRGLLKFMDNPQHAFPTVHVAGTNGKGSTCAMLDSIFRAAGHKTGLYTSPHLFHFSERIKINGVPIPEDEIVRLTLKMKNKIDELECTFFEATTALAFEYFKENKVDIAIIETGLGGRLDATNVVEPLLSVITNIDLEHTEHLGKTVESIAFEKAGIMKPDRPCLCGNVNQDVRRIFESTASSRQCELFYSDATSRITNERSDIEGSKIDLHISLGAEDAFFNDLHIGLAGKHQIQNAALAVNAVYMQKKFKVTEDAVRSGLANVRWSARLEIIRKEPWIIADAAHNPAGMRVLSEALHSLYKPRFQRLYLIIGMLADKNYDEAVPIIAPHFDRIYTVTPNNGRALKAEILAESIGRVHSGVQTAETLKLAVSEVESKMSSRDMLLITGSHFLLSELKDIRQAS